MFIDDVTNPTEPLLSDLSGMAEARLWGEALAHDMDLYRSGRLAWEHLSSSCILYGPSGTGKALFARALAATCGVPLVSANLPVCRDLRQVISSPEGLQKLYALALKNAPSICFIDRIDNLLSCDNGDGTESFIRNTRAYLNLFDGHTRESKGFVLVGAANHRLLPEHELFRSGRIHRLFPVPLPSQKELEAIIAFHLTPEERAGLANDDRSGHHGLSTIAALCAGLSGRDVAENLRTARGIARRSGQPLSREHWVEAVDPASKRLSREPQLRRVVHEAGHAVVAVRLKLLPDIVASVVPHSTLVDRVDPDAVTGSVTLTMTLELIAILLAGRAAEEIVFGEASALSGGRTSDSDLAKATALGRDAVNRFGFSQQNPLAWQPVPSARQNHDAETSTEITAILEAAHAYAKQQIESDLDHLFAVAQTLIDARALSYADLTALQRSRGSTPAVGKAEFRRHLDAAFDRASKQRPILIQQVREIGPEKLPRTVEVHQGETGSQGQPRAAHPPGIADEQADTPTVKRFLNRLIRRGADQ